MENGLPWYDANSGYAGDDYISDTKTGRDWRWQLFMKAPGDVKATENITTPETFPTTPCLYIRLQKCHIYWLYSGKRAFDGL